MKKFNIHDAIRKGSLTDVKKALKKGASVNETNASKQTPLHTAAIEGQMTILLYLIEKKKGDVNSKDRDGWTPLHCACHSGHLEIVDLLISHDANLNFETSNGSMPMHYFVRMPAQSTRPALFERLFRTMIRKGVNINQQNKQGETPLHMAAFRGKEQSVSLLLWNQADPNLKNKYGETPLHLAARAGYANVLKQLLDANADYTISGTNGTAYEIAINNNNQEMITIFEEKMKPEHKALLKQSLEKQKKSVDASSVLATQQPQQPQQPQQNNNSNNNNGVPPVEKKIDLHRSYDPTASLNHLPSNYNPQYNNYAPYMVPSQTPGYPVPYGYPNGQPGYPGQPQFYNPYMQYDPNMQFAGMNPNQVNPNAMVYPQGNQMNSMNQIPQIMNSNGQPMNPMNSMNQHMYSQTMQHNEHQTNTLGTNQNMQTIQNSGTINQHTVKDANSMITNQNTNVPQTNQQPQTTPDTINFNNMSTINQYFPLPKDEQKTETKVDHHSVETQKITTDIKQQNQQQQQQPPPPEDDKPKGVSVSNRTTLRKKPTGNTRGQSLRKAGNLEKSQVGEKSKRPTSSREQKAPPGNPTPFEPPRLENYHIGELIDRGAFGAVYRGLDMKTGAIVAIKQVLLAGVPPKELQTIMAELNLLKRLENKYIVKYIGYVQDESNINLIMEFVEGGSLAKLIQKFGKIPEPLCARYISQVLLGLDYIHRRGVIHRDIKCANILITKDGTVKLADFGIAATPEGQEAEATLKTLKDGQYKNNNSNKEAVGSPYWMAPEIILLEGASTNSDIWSLGCTIIELVSGSPPYIDLAPMAALFAVVQDPHPPVPVEISNDLRDFLLSCFNKQPNERPTARELLKHPFIFNNVGDLTSELQSSSSPAESHRLTSPTPIPTPTPTPTPTPNPIAVKPISQAAKPPQEMKKPIMRTTRNDPSNSQLGSNPPAAKPPQPINAQQPNKPNIPVKAGSRQQVVAKQQVAVQQHVKPSPPVINEEPDINSSIAALKQFAEVNHSPYDNLGSLPTMTNINVTSILESFNAPHSNNNVHTTDDDHKTDDDDDDTEENKTDDDEDDDDDDEDEEKMELHRISKNLGELMKWTRGAIDANQGSRACKLRVALRKEKKVLRQKFRHLQEARELAADIRKLCKECEQKFSENISLDDSDTDYDSEDSFFLPDDDEDEFYDDGF